MKVILETYLMKVILETVIRKRLKSQVFYHNVCLIVCKHRIKYQIMKTLLKLKQKIVNYRKIKELDLQMIR
jgi:hypothetical protein